MQTLFSDINQCSQSSGTDTPRNAYENEQAKAGGQDCTCMNVMSSCLIHPRGVGEWIASMRDSLAKIFQSPEMAQALKEIGAGYGQKLSGSLARYDHANCSWKIAQQSLLEDLEPCLEIWPSWGMTRSGACYPLPQLVPRTYALDGGASPDWQTPVADDAVNRSKGKWNSRGEPKLSAQVMIPTPTVCGNYNRKGASKTSGDGLATFVAKWPTPTAQDAKNSTLPPSQMGRDSIPGALLRNGEKAGGQLNPTWVEWLMGWPIGATELKHSEMDKCHSKQQQHTHCCGADFDEP